MLGMILADTITIKIGDNVWTFGTNLIVYLIVAAIVGVIAEFMVGWRLPFGIIGAIIAALIGIWLMTQVIIMSGVPDFGLNPLIYLLVAAIVGFVAEAILGWRLPFGTIGAIIAALVGIWLMTQVIIISGIGDIYFDGVPLFRALIGAMILVALWHLLTYGLWRRRDRYY